MKYCPPDVGCRSSLVSKVAGPSLSSFQTWIISCSLVSISLAFGRFPNCYALTYFSSNDGCHTTGFSTFILNMPKLASRTHSPPNFHQTCPTVRPVLRRYGHATHLIVLFDTALVTTAIATSVGVVIVAALITIAMALCFIRAQRDRYQSKRVSIFTPVIDICRPTHSNVDRDSRVVAPQRPREALLSCKAATPCSPESLHPANATAKSPAILPRYPGCPKI